MQPIALEFSEGHYVHRQIRREGMLAIYEQRHKDADVRRYEVVRLHIQRARTWPNGQTTPEQEVYPSPSAWGSAGWTCFTLLEAEALFADLQKETPA